MVITQYIQNEPEISISEENNDSIQYDAQECNPVDTKNPKEVAYEVLESLDLHTVDIDLDEKAEKQDPVELGVVDMEAADARDESLTLQGDKAMVKNQKEAIELVSLYTIKQPFVKLERLDLSGRQFSNIFNPGPPKRGRPKKAPQNKTLCRKKQEKKKVTVPSASMNKYAFIMIIIIIIIIILIYIIPSQTQGCFTFLEKKCKFFLVTALILNSLQACRTWKRHLQHCSKVKEDM